MTWKKPLSKVPKAVSSAVQNMSGDLLIVSASKVVSVDDIESGVYSHLWAALPVDVTVSTLPEAGVGRFAALNISGWEIKRTDLPKIEKATRFWETPNFGDGSRYGYTTHVAHQKVYPREYFEAPRAEIETEVLKRPEGSGRNYLVRFSVDKILDRKSATFDSNLVFCLNLLRESVGVIGVMRSDATREDYMKTIAMDWEIFPPGSVDEVVAAFKAKSKVATVDELAIVRSRVMLFERLKPEAYIKGSGGFGSYFGAKFADDLVVFENLKYGNALYVLYEEWLRLAKRSRSDLIAGADTGFDRIEHRTGWEKVLRKLLTKEIAKRAKKS